MITRNASEIDVLSVNVPALVILIGYSKLVLYAPYVLCTKNDVWSGRVVLIVNVACKCGLTNTNYEQLQAMHTRLAERGLSILAFPCNQFMSQVRLRMRWSTLACASLARCSRWPPPEALADCWLLTSDCWLLTVDCWLLTARSNVERRGRRTRRSRGQRRRSRSTWARRTARSSTCSPRWTWTAPTRTRSTSGSSRASRALSASALPPTRSHSRALVHLLNCSSTPFLFLHLIRDEGWGTCLTKKMGAA